MNKLSLFFLSFVIAGSGSFFSVQASNLSLADKPLFTGDSTTPMMMIVMGRDHTLFYEAYNDAADLDGVLDANGNTNIDLKFKPSISYEGYFDSEKCYSYSSNIFSPASKSNTCTTAGHWSGNFLNYITMTRMDLLRKVLYGGKRSTDVSNNTILERSYIPQDAHSWAKSYTSIAIDKYDIADYTPYVAPTNNKQHFFGSVTYTSDSSDPTLRVITNAYYKQSNENREEDFGVWNWTSTERPVLNNNRINKDASADFTVRVQVCVANLLEDNCKKYVSPGGESYKPTGLLHDYGDSDKMLFGLLTGSYNKNLSGGVLRRAIGEFSQEVDQSTGQFTSVEGIVDTINKIKIYGFNYTGNGKNYSYDADSNDCGWITNRPLNEGECVSWGNPVGEMLYESLRYLAGEGSASSTYQTSGGVDAALGLPNGSWTDPFADGGIPHCTRATNLLISDINPSYDSDQLPGVHSSFQTSYQGSTLSGFDVSTLLGKISEAEGKQSGDYFIGQSGSNSDGAPTPKAITGLTSLRGLPAEPTKMGSYSAAAVAHYGLINDVNSNKDNTQNVKTMVVALASSLPEIKIDVDGHIIKIIPFAKSVGGSSTFKPTNTIVDWYTESLDETSGTFLINFEDVEQGADHDMDMVVKYSYNVIDNLCYPTSENCTEYRKGVEITLNSTYAYGNADQHAGYIISGSNHDRLYLEVEDHKDGGGSRQRYKLDTPSAADFSSRGTNNTGDYLPYDQTRIFFPSDSTAAEFLPSPLEYAAKWGGFVDSNDNNIPDVQAEWDANNDGLPDTYFPVTNAGELKSQLARAFSDAFEGDASTTAPIFSSNFLRQGTTVYQSSFEGKTWSGDIKAFQADANGVFKVDPEWSASDQLDAITLGNRNIYSYNGNANFEFTVPTSEGVLAGAADSYSEEQITALLGVTGTNLSNDTDKFNYLKKVVEFLRGERSIEEQQTAGITFRKRTSRLGDIVNSTPYYVAPVNGHHVSKEVLVFGANDGMVHIIDAQNGKELMAYIPSAVYSKLNALTQSIYTHEYLVDGGINAYTEEVVAEDGSTTTSNTTVVGTLGTGAQGLYAIDVSNMSSVSKDNVKWEISASGDYAGLGYTNSTPTIVELANGEVGVVFSNGYNSTEMDGAIYIAKLSDGSLIKKLSVGTRVDPSNPDEPRPNAIATPAVVDLDSDGIADRIYAGDLYGNMWVFDISNKDDLDEWGLATSGNAPLFIAKSPTQKDDEYIYQPITTRPSVGLPPTGYPKTNGVLVAFGTGKYIESGDNVSADQATQSFYVIWDKYQTNERTSVITSTEITSSRDSSDSDKYTDLLHQEIIDEDADNRELSEHLINWEDQSGFYIDLINTEPGYAGGNLGERQVTNSLLLANKVIFTTLLPNDDACSAGGSSWYMEMNIHTGRSWSGDSNKKLYGIATEVKTIIALPPDSTPSPTPTPTPTSTPSSTPTPVPTVTPTPPNEPIQKTCVTLSTGKTVCFDDKNSPIGRLSWKQLY